MSTKVHSIISKGSQGTIVDIECHLSNNLPTIIIIGSANKAVDESKEKIRGAFAASRIMLPRKRVTVNLAPADVPKADSGVDHDKLLIQAADPDQDQAARDRIIKARRRQLRRFGNSKKLNADMSSQDIRQSAALSAPAKLFLNDSAQRLNLSARAYMRVIKVARTIADLDGSRVITAPHMANAIRYRLDTVK